MTTDTRALRLAQIGGLKEANAGRKSYEPAKATVAELNYLIRMIEEAWGGDEVSGEDKGLIERLRRTRRVRTGVTTTIPPLEYLMCDEPVNPDGPDTADRIEQLLSHLSSAREEALEALKPFARVVHAYDYWEPEVMPEWSYPVAGTNLALAQEDCPKAIGSLTRQDFERARQAIRALKDRKP